MASLLEFLPSMPLRRLLKSATNRCVTAIGVHIGILTYGLSNDRIVVLGGAR